MTEKQGERVARLEQMAKDTEAKLNTILVEIKDIKYQLNLYATKEELKVYTQTNKRFMEVYFWPAQVFSMLFGSGITFLIIEYLRAY